VVGFALALTFRCLLASDADWLTENANDPEVARYAISVYPISEREVGEFLKKDLEESSEKYIVAVLDGEAAGFVSLWFRPGAVRDRHVAWVGIAVRRKFWGRGVGTGLMREAMSLARKSGFRKLMLGTIEGNERAVRLYGNLGFKTEAYEANGVYVDGSWKNSFLMGLELAPCEPKLGRNSVVKAKDSEASDHGDICVRQAMNGDLDELHRLQNCPESTKSTYRLPPTTKEETKKWYEKLNSEEGRHCLVCSKGNKLLGYLHFRAGRHPFPSLKSEEILVDIGQEPDRAANALISGLKSFRERYWYTNIFAYAPETSLLITDTLANQGFKKNGAMKDYYFIDGNYVDSAVYAYP
jgi:RimJ/RimL family protein N-acetyltransferase